MNLLPWQVLIRLIFRIYTNVSKRSPGNAFFASQTFDDAEVITQHRNIREKGQVTKLILLSQPFFIEWLGAI